MRCHVALFILLLLGALATAGSLFAQENPETITGLVSDPTGALIPEAQISAAHFYGPSQTTVSDARGLYILQLPAGEYQLEASAPGFQTSKPVTERILSGRTLKHDIRLELGVVSEEVLVSEASVPEAEPANNASAITLSGSNLESLADDPEDLTDDLIALAGPSAGPDGGELYVDGFSGGKLPPKSSIRDVRVNQNPFSAEYDRIGFGRIEVLTKPGAAKFHGEGRFNFGDSMFYARNPFAAEKPDFQRHVYEGTFTGPVNRNSSFTVQLERRNIGQTAVIKALILAPNLNPATYRLF